VAISSRGCAYDDEAGARCHVRDPSWFQWPLLDAVVERATSWPTFRCATIFQLFVTRTRPVDKPCDDYWFQSLINRPVTEAAPRL